MPHFFERTALILLASTALTAPVAAQTLVSPQPAQPAPAAQAAEPPLLAVDAAAKARSKAASSTYTVRRGDTLAEIADRLGTDIPTLARANGLKKPYRLQPGKVLKIPGAASADANSAERATPERERTPTAATTHTVKRGETLFSISKRYGVSVADLQRANGYGRSSRIDVGTKLKLPGGNEPESAEVDMSRRQAPPTKARPRRTVEPTQVEDTGGPLVTGRSVTGRVVDVPVPGKAYKVRKGDTLEKIARRLDTDIDDLARINKLKKPYRLQPGQTIRGSGGSAKAYVVASGDTLGEIAQRFGTTTDKLRAANGLRRGASVAPGRRLRLPAGYRDRGPVLAVRETPPEPTSPPPSSFRTPPPVGQTLPPPRSTAEGLPTTPQPYTGVPRPPPPSSSSSGGNVSGAPTASAPVSDAQIMQMGRGLFSWPVRGDILSGFGGRGSGPRNDGLDIRAQAGDPVRAAASGDVVYAGDQVPGFGNLVLIKHADGWVTAYGHLGKVDVRMQQKVTQGQQIGQAGTTGGVSEPQLHFEVRYAPNPQERARPIDPALVLPK